MPGRYGTCRQCHWWTPLSRTPLATELSLPGWGRCGYATEAIRGDFNRTGPGRVIDRDGAWHRSGAAEYGLPLTRLLVYNEFGEEGGVLVAAPDFSCSAYVARQRRPGAPVQGPAAPQPIVQALAHDLTLLTALLELLLDEPALPTPLQESAGRALERLALADAHLQQLRTALTQ